MTDEECKALATVYADKIKASGGNREVLQNIGHELSKERLADDEFESVAQGIIENEAPEAPQGGSVVVIGGPSREVSFVIGLARKMRAIRPPI